MPQATLVPVNVFAPNQGSLSPTIGGTSAQVLYNGLQYITQNPFAQDPVRAGSINRLTAANFGFGTTQSYQTEGVAYRNDPQIVLALKNQFNRFRQLGIAPIAASGQFGTPVGNATASTTFGDTQGEALPAVLNEVISVGGTYSFPFATGPTSNPTDPSPGALPRPLGPVLVTDNTGAIIGTDLTTLTAGDLTIFKDKILAASNRTYTTDYVAPALDVPTFSRIVSGTTTTNVGGTGLNVFQQGGTSLSSAMVTGSFSLVSSALNFWNNIVNNGGVTDSAYLNTPVGTHVLNFGAGGLPNLSAYENPDAVNAILQWTAVPVEDAPVDGLVPGTSPGGAVNPSPLFPNAGGAYPNYSRIDVGNAIAAIEGTEALYYLINHGTFDIIDSNHNGLITAQELQNFEDNAAAMGMPEAGAMARLLGGTARIPTDGFQTTAAGESPDQPDVLQRRFNFFDYAVDGQLNGAISIDQYKQLLHNLLPAPDSFVIVDRQRSSGDGYLLQPDKVRNYVSLQRLKPRFVWVPASVTRRFRNVSPSRFGVGRGQLPSAVGPDFTLFGNGGISNASNKGGSGSGSGTNTAQQTPTSGSTGTGTTTGSNPGSNSATSGGSTTGSTTSAPPIVSSSTESQTTPSYGQQAMDNFLQAIQQSVSSSTPSSTASTTSVGTAQPTGSSATPVVTTSSTAANATTASSDAGTPAAKSEGSTTNLNTTTATPIMQTQSQAVRAPQNNQAAVLQRRAQLQNMINQRNELRQARLDRLTQMVKSGQPIPQPKSQGQKIWDRLFGWL